MNNLTSAIINFFKKTYFFIFYTIAFLINLDRTTDVIIPLLFFFYYVNKLNVINFLSVILFTIITNIIYNIVYVINDKIDQRKDIKNNKLKITVVSIYNFNNYLYLFLVFILGGLFVLWKSSPQMGFYLGLYFVVLSLLTVLHSAIQRLKPATFFLENFFKLFTPIFIANLLVLNKVDGFIIFFFLLCYPAFIDKSYIEYMNGQQFTNPRNDMYLCYLIYYVILLPALSIFFLSGTRLITYVSLIIFCIIFFGGKYFFIKRKPGFLILNNYLNKIFGEEFPRKKEFFLSGLVNLFCFIILWTILATNLRIS
jgi:hypothetical protein